MDKARKISLYILNTLKKDHKTLDNVLDDVLQKETRLLKKDRALIQALVYGVLRWQGRLDWIIAHFSSTPLNKIDSTVMNILRLGLFQTLYLSRIPVSAAVNTSVDMAKSTSRPHVVRYVNGVLRNAARNYQEVPFPDMIKDPVSALAANKSFPKWLAKRWLDRFGLKESVQLCDAINTIPPITARCNTLKTRREKLAKFLQEDAEQVDHTDYSPDGVFFFRPKKSIPEISSFKDGLFQIQDEAAQLVTLLLNPKPGETVLDACAGLGGKTGHIAQMMKNRGKIVALDKDNKKCPQLNAEMDRLGISIVTTLVHDLNHPLQNRTDEMFDRVLLDAPCSGLGVLRRNPDAKWSTLESDLSSHSERQMIFLDNLSRRVKTAGVLVYSVCSMEPEENEWVIKDFLNKHPAFTTVKNPVGLPYKARALVTGEGYLKTFPHRHNMDGFFSICMKRTR